MMPTSLASQLRDIHLPLPPPWWDVPLGWKMIGVAVLLSIGVVSYFLVKFLRKKQAKRQVLRLLASLQVRATQKEAVVSEVAHLLRVLALKRYPREEVARLYGREWLAFLNKTGKTGAFTENPLLRVLADGPYQANATLSPEVFNEIKAWVNKHV